MPNIVEANMIAKSSNEGATKMIFETNMIANSSNGGATETKKTRKKVFKFKGFSFRMWGRAHSQKRPREPMSTQF